MLAEAQSVHVLQAVPWSWLAVNYVGETLRRARDPHGQTYARRGGGA
jgi:hypothetical protein